MNNKESECEEMRFLDRWKKPEMKTDKKIAMKKCTNANRNRRGTCLQILRERACVSRCESGDSTGKIYGVVGNNGSGKTVLMKCICGFMHPDKGQIYVGGSRVGKECDFPDKLGVIIETPGFLPALSGYKNLKILADLKGRIGKNEIIETLQRVGLNPKMKKPVSKYSLGMRQRLGIAQAIMENPDVLILDEPFNGLDKAGVAEMRQLLLSLKESGKAIMLASHNAQDIGCCVIMYMKWRTGNETKAYSEENICDDNRGNDVYGIISGRKCSCSTIMQYRYNCIQHRGWGCVMLQYAGLSM